MHTLEFFDDEKHIRSSIDDTLDGLGQMSFDDSRIEITVNVTSEVSDIPASVSISTVLNCDSFDTIRVNDKLVTADDNKGFIDEYDDSFGCAVTLLRALGALIADFGV